MNSDKTRSAAGRLRHPAAGALLFVGGRLLGALPVLFFAVTITFFLIRFAPGGPFTDEKRYSAESLAQLQRHYGLDLPVHAQYLRYLASLLRGDLGPSFQYPGQSVNRIIAQTFPVSLELGLLALAFALALGLGAGIVSAVRPNSAADHATMAFAMTGICVPSFVLGPLLVWAFAIGLGWFNAAGWEAAGDRVLPAITLGAAYAAYIARLTRAGMLETLTQDYIRTARAKGLGEAQVIVRHALRNGLLPVAAFLGPAAAGLVTGSFVVETVFQVPGMGKMFVTAAFNRDYTLILGLVVFYAAIIVLFNTLVDLAQVWLNPRLRTGKR